MRPVFVSSTTYLIGRFVEARTAERASCAVISWFTETMSMSIIGLKWFSSRSISRAMRDMVSTASTG